MRSRRVSCVKKVEGGREGKTEDWEAKNKKAVSLAYIA